MSHQPNDMIEWLRSIYQISLQALIEGNARVSTWLVVGNAGALVFAFQALIGGSTCDVSLVAAPLWLFILGLAAAFLAVALGALVGSALLQTLSDVINTLWLIERHERDLEQIVAEHGPQPDDSPLSLSIVQEEAKSQGQLEKLKTIQKETRGLIWLQAVSVLFFGAGVTWPVLAPGLIASCAAAPS
jgi:hypothetical protein